MTSFHLEPSFSIKPSHLLTIISASLALMKHVEIRAHVVINCDKYLVNHGSYEVHTSGENYYPSHGKKEL